MPGQMHPSIHNHKQQFSYPDRMNKQLHTGEGMNEQNPLATEQIVQIVLSTPGVTVRWGGVGGEGP